MNIFRNNGILRDSWNEAAHSNHPNSGLLGHVEYWKRKIPFHYPVPVSVAQALIATSKLTENEEISPSVYRSLSDRDLEILHKIVSRHGRSGHPPSDISARAAQKIDEYINFKNNWSNIALSKPGLLGHVEYWEGDLRHNSLPLPVLKTLMSIAVLSENMVLPPLVYRSLSIRDLAILTKILKRHANHGRPPSLISGNSARDIQEFMELRKSWSDVVHSTLPNKGLLRHVEYWKGSLGNNSLPISVLQVLVVFAKCSEDELPEADFYLGLKENDLSMLYGILRRHGSYGSPPSIISNRIAHQIERSLLALEDRSTLYKISVALDENPPPRSSDLPARISEKMQALQPWNGTDQVTFDAFDLIFQQIINDSLQESGGFATRQEIGSIIHCSRQWREAFFKVTTSKANAILHNLAGQHLLEPEENAINALPPLDKWGLVIDTWKRWEDQLPYLREVLPNTPPLDLMTKVSAENVQRAKEIKDQALVDFCGLLPDELRGPGGLDVHLNSQLTLEEKAQRLRNVLVNSPVIKEVAKISLKNGALTFIPPEIRCFESLDSLTISNHSIKEIPRALFSMTSITSLNLSNNKLKKIPPELTIMTSLTDLNLINNEIDKIPPELADHPTLDGLYLNLNKIRKIPPEFGSSRLLYFNLHENPISELPTTLSKMPKVRGLYLSNLPYIPEEFAELIRTKRMSFSVQ